MGRRLKDDEYIHVVGRFSGFDIVREAMEIDTSVNLFGKVMKIRLAYSPFEFFLHYKDLNCQAYVPSIVYGLRKASSEEILHAIVPSEDLVAIYVF